MSCSHVLISMSQAPQAHLVIYSDKDKCILYLMSYFYIKFSCFGNKEYIVLKCRIRDQCILRQCWTFDQVAQPRPHSNVTGAVSGNGCSSSDTSLAAAE